MNTRKFEIVKKVEDSQDVYYITECSDDIVRISDRGLKMDLLTNSTRRFFQTNNVRLAFYLTLLRRALLLPSLTELKADTLGELLNEVKKLSEQEEINDRIKMFAPSLDDTAEDLHALTAYLDSDDEDSKQGASLALRH